MKSKNLIVIIIAMVLISTVGYFVANQSPTTPQDNTDGLSKNTNPVAKQRSDDSDSTENSMNDESAIQYGSSSSTTGGDYIIYSEEAFRDASDKKRVLFFYASWCPICRPVDKELTEREDELPEDVVVYRVNYDDANTEPHEEALADKYDITYQHTFVLVDENGNEILKWNGGSFEDIIDRIT